MPLSMQRVSLSSPCFHSPCATEFALLFRRPQFVEGAEELEFSDALCMDILKYSMAQTTQPFTVVLAAFAVLLHKYTREENVAIGSSTAAYAPLPSPNPKPGSSEVAATGGAGRGREFVCWFFY